MLFAESLPARTMSVGMVSGEEVGMQPAMRTPASIAFDEDGLLVNPDDWDEALAADIARREGIGPLTDEHWEVIHALREHYAQFGVAPSMSHVCQAHGRGRHWVHDLFHTCLGAWRVAGLPNPGEEAKSYLSGM